MGASLTIECDIHFRRRGGGKHKELQTENLQPDATRAGRVPRISRLMALTIRFDFLLQAGAIRDYAELAKLGHVSRARVSQIMNLRLLAPDIQEQILCLPRTEHGRDPIHLRHLQTVARVIDWRRQRLVWSKLCRVRQPG